jgi:hypothetical protein
MLAFMILRTSLRFSPFSSLTLISLWCDVPGLLTSAKLGAARRVWFASDRNCLGAREADV